MAKQQLTPRMQQVLSVVQGSRVDGMRGVLRNSMIPLDHGYFARATTALVKRGLLIRCDSQTAGLLWMVP